MKRILALALLVILGILWLMQDPEEAPAAVADTPSSESRGRQTELFEETNSTPAVRRSEIAVPGPDSPDEEPEPVLYGTVTVALVGAESGEPVTMGRVKAARGVQQRGAELQVDKNGEAEFVLPVDDYTFVVFEESLPIGMMPPPLQRRVTESFMEGFAAATATVEHNGHARVVISIHRAGRVQGYVRDRDGSPVEGAVVRANSTRLAEPQVSHDAKTDELGYYEIDLKPSDYRLTSFIPITLAESTLSNATKPAPIDFHVRAHEEANIDLTYRAGDCHLSGVLLDPALVAGEEDIYWEDFQVIVVPVRDESESREGIRELKLHGVAHTKTDAKGRWRVENLVPGRYQIAFNPHSGYTPSQRNCKLACWVPRLFVDLDAPGEHDSGFWVAPRGRPCDVTGRVVFTQPVAGSFDLELVYPRRHDDEGEPYSKPVRMKSDRTFSSFVHTLPDPIPAQIRLRRRGEPEWEVVQDFDPVPNGTRHLEIEYP